MSKNISRLSFLFLAVGVVIVVTALVSIQKPVTANVKNSPNALSAGDPIVLYQYVSSLGEAEKREVYRKLVSRDKSAIWKVHMSAYLAGHPELSEEQQGVILEAISLATPGYFDIPVHALDSEAEMDKKVAMLKRRALSVFRKGEAGVIFASLNKLPATPTGSQITGLGKFDSWVVSQLGGTYQIGGTYLKPDRQGAPLLMPRLLIPSATTYLLPDPCNCNRGDDWCWNNCRNTGCQGSGGGCGWWLGYPCNGEC